MTVLVDDAFAGVSPLGPLKCVPKHRRVSAAWKRGMAYLHICRSSVRYWMVTIFFQALFTKIVGTNSGHEDLGSRLGGARYDDGRLASENRNSQLT
jgi:hypothetical protein